MQIPSLILEVGARVVEFKSFSEMKDLHVQFGQDAFIKSFELCQKKVAERFSKLDLDFLDEASDNEAGPFETAADPPPVGTSLTAAVATADLPGTSSPSASAPEVRNL